MTTYAPQNLKARLTLYRANAERYAKTNPAMLHTALNSRYPRPAILAPRHTAQRDISDQKNIYIGDLDAFNFQYARDINHKLNRGYYVDCYQDGIVRAAVIQIRTNKHDVDKRRYLAATASSFTDSATVYTRHVYDDPRDAARAADVEAEAEADRAREAWLEDEVDYLTHERRDILKRIERLKNDPYQLFDW